MCVSKYIDKSHLEEENNMDSKKPNKKEIVFYIIVPIICAILTAIGAYFVQDKHEESLVKSMVGRFERIEENMDLEQALDLAFEEKHQLETQLEGKVEIDIYSPALVVNGLRKEDAVGQSVVIFEGNTYFSADICSKIWGTQPVFNQSENIIYFGESGNSLIENKVDLISANVLYDGKYLTVYKPSESDTFSMGSDTFNKGFTIGSDNYSLFGEGNGYALFDLKGQYSKLSVNVARVNRSDLGIEDATLKVYLNGEYKTEYSLSGQKPPTIITIDLNYANDLKLELCGSKIVYGFADCTLEK